MHFPQLTLRCPMVSQTTPLTEEIAVENRASTSALWDATRSNLDCSLARDLKQRELDLIGSETATMVPPRLPREKARWVWIRLHPGSTASNEEFRAIHRDWHRGTPLGQELTNGASRHNQTSFLALGVTPVKHAPLTYLRRGLPRIEVGTLDPAHTRRPFKRSCK